LLTVLSQADAVRCLPQLTNNGMQFAFFLFHI
jgi:hypothetical protein